jgi:hypothetical protein
MSKTKQNKIKQNKARVSPLEDIQPKKISDAKDKLVLLRTHVSQNMKDSIVHGCDLPLRRY